MMLGINQRIVLGILQEQLIEEGSSGNDIAIEMIERCLRIMRC